MTKEFLINYNWFEAMKRLYGTNDFIDTRSNIPDFYEELELLINKKYKFNFNISTNLYNLCKKFY